MDLEALDSAAATHNFSGVVTVDVGDSRALERCYGSAHRALGVPNAPTTRGNTSEGAWPVIMHLEELWLELVPG